MALPTNNQVYTAAYAGALSGMGVGSRMLSANTSIAQLAGAWASSFDSAWNSATQIDQLQHDAIQSASEAAWLGLNPIVDTTSLTPATYTNQIQQIIAQITAGETYFTSQGNTPPPYGGGGGSINPLMAALVFVATLASPGIGQAAPAGIGNQTGYTTILSAQNGQTNNPGQGGQGGNYVIQGGAGGGSSTAVANTNGGNIIAEPGPAGTGGSGAAGHSGYFIVSPGGVPAIQMGFVSGSVPALWNGGVSPSTSNYGLTLASTQTTLNSPSLPLSLSIANISIWEIAAVGSSSSLALGTPSSTNFAISTDGLTVTVVNAPGTGLVEIGVNGTPVFKMGVLVSVPGGSAIYGEVTPSNSNFMIATDNATVTQVNAPTGGTVDFSTAGTVSWQMGFITSQSALWAGVSPTSGNYFAVQTATQTVINTQTTGFVLLASASTPSWQFGLVPFTSLDGIYGGTVTPNSTNYAFAYDSSTTVVNGPGNVTFANAGVTMWAMQPNSGAAALYANAVSPGASNYVLQSSTGSTVVNAQASSASAGAVTLAVDGTPIFAVTQNSGIDELIAGNFPSTACFTVDGSGFTVVNAPNAGAAVLLAVDGTTYLNAGSNGLTLPPLTNIPLSTINVALGSAQAAPGSITFTGNVTAAITVTFPNVAGSTWFLNVTNLTLSGAGSVTFKSGTGTFTTLHSTPTVGLIVLQTTGNNNFVTSYLN